MEISKFDQAAMAQIRKHEGVRNRPYQDSLGNWTVGIGHYIGKELPEGMDRRFTRKEIDQLFVEDYFSHKKDAEKVPGYERLDDKGRTVLIDLMYNIGLTTFNKFKKMKAAIAAGDTKTAAAEMQDSRWYTQTGNRSRALVAMMQESQVLPEPEPVLPEETAPPEPRVPEPLPEKPPAPAERPAEEKKSMAEAEVAPITTEIKEPPMEQVDIVEPELPPVEVVDTQEQPVAEVTQEPAARPGVDTIINAPEDVVDPYSIPADPTVDPLPTAILVPPTDTEITNVATLETMGRLAEGQDTDIASTYEQAKGDAEYNSDALKARFVQYLSVFNRETTQVVLGQADPEIVADKIQEDTEIEQSVIAPYMGAVMKAYPNAPRGIQEKTAARYYAMSMLSEYLKGYTGWDVAADIAQSMIPFQALIDVEQSEVKPEMVEAVKQLSAEDQARFYTALLTQLDEAYDSDKVFVAGIFEAFLSPDGENTLAVSQNLEKIFAGLDAIAILGTGAKLARNMKVVRDAKLAGNKELADNTVATGIKDAEGKVAEALGVSREELVQAALPFRNDTVEGLDHIPDTPGALPKLAPVNQEEIQRIRDAGVAVLTQEVLSPRLLRDGDVAGAIDRITKETQRQLAEAYENTAFETGSIRVVKKEGEDVFVVTVDVLGPVDVRTGKLGDDEFESLVEFLDIPAKQKKALLREFDEGGDPQQIIEDFVGNRAVVTQGIQDFRTARTTTKGTVNTETFEARPTLDDYGTFQIVQNGPIKSTASYALSPIEKLDRELVLGGELTSTAREAIASGLGAVFKKAMEPLRVLRDPFGKSRAKVEKAYVLWERATKTEYDAAGNVVSVNNTRPTPYQLAYEGIPGPDGKPVYLKSQAERQAFYNIAEVMDLFYIMGNKMELETARTLGLRQININETLRGLNKGIIPVNEGLRGAPRLTKAQYTATLDNLEEGASVFDVVAGKSLNKEQALAKLEDSDNVLVSMFDAMRKADDSFERVVIVPRSAIADLNPYQRARRNLYSPKINVGLRGAVIEVRNTKVNGIEKLATDPDNPNRKAVRFVERVADGERIAQELSEAAVREGRTDTRYIFQEDSIDPMSGEFRNFSKTGLFKGGRSSRDIRVGLEETEVETVDLFKAITRNLQHLSNQYPINQWRMAQQQRFINTVNSSAGNSTQKITSFSDTISDAHPNKAQLEEIRDYLKQQFRIPSKEEVVFEKKMLEIADWIDGKGLTSLSKTVMRLKDSSVTAKIRALNSHVLLGMFNPAQLWVQAQNASIAVSMHPWFATKGVPRALALRYGLYADDEVLSVIAKRGNLNVDDYVATMKAFRRTGLHLSVRNNADFDAAIQGYTITGKFFKWALDKGLGFYRQGEIAGRVFAWEIATQKHEAASKRAISAFTDDDWREVFKLHQNITLNMSNANRAKFQEGVASVPTQFFQVTSKFVEAVMLNGREFTLDQKIRMILGQGVLYGAVGIPAGRWLVDTAAGYFGVSPEDVTREQVIFLRDGIVGFLSDGQLSMSDRSSINSGLERFVDGIFDGEFSPVDLFLGPTEAAWERGKDVTALIEPLLFNRSDSVSTVELLALIGTGLLEIPSSTRNAIKALEMSHIQKYIDDRHSVVYTDPTFTEIVGKAIGFQTTRETLSFLASKDQRTAQEYIDYKAKKLVDLYTRLQQVKGLTGEEFDVDKANALMNALAVQLDIDYNANPAQALAIRKRAWGLLQQGNTKVSKAILQVKQDSTGMANFLNDATILKSTEVE